MSQAWPVVTVEQMRALEAAAFAAGTSEDRLQARAAAEIAGVAAEVAPRTSPAVILVGPGNNGRDAFLAGRRLAAAGREVSYYLGPRHAVREAELAALRPPLEAVLLHRQEPDLELLRTRLGRAGLAIDGLLGIGLRGPLRAPLDRLAQLLNEVSAGGAPRVLSVDVPSGIDADSGALAGPAVRADLTVALGAAKAGLLRFPAANLVGRLEVRPIGLPQDAVAACRTRLLTPDAVAPLVPPRPLDAHKGTLGWVMVLGGSREYVGAPILSASAAARAGCGLVALATPAPAQLAAAVALPEATYVLRDEQQAPSVQAERLLDRLNQFQSLIIGPGLGREQTTVSLVRGLLQGLTALPERPATLIDADALFVLAGWPEWWQAIPPGCVLTPHHGEMARLTGLQAAELAARTWDLAAEYAARWGQIVVLKGPHTVVAAPDGRAWVYPRPNPGLATAGSGDVLAGLIAGLAAQGVAPLEAARLGVVTHALAADRVLGSRQWRSLIASDLLAALPAVLADLGD